jgi:hypothetical protein
MRLWTSPATTVYVSAASSIPRLVSVTASRSRSRGSPSIHVPMPISQRARCGVNVTRFRLVAGTRSIHTVCQMPVVRGYQIE